ncbi:hypothetical protein BDW62DRAFT_215387 [Aspergillus aurantiobrunneus]
MPANNSSPDASLTFLYLCMTHSDMTKVNYEALAAATGLKVPAARMRFTRLKKHIESTMAEGKASVGAGVGAGDLNEEQEDGDAAPATPSPTKKRKVAQKAGGAKGKNEKGKGVQSGVKDEEDEDGGTGFVKDEDMSDA